MLQSRLSVVHRCDAVVTFCFICMTVDEAMLTCLFGVVHGPCEAARCVAEYRNYMVTDNYNVLKIFDPIVTHITDKPTINSAYYVVNSSFSSFVCPSACTQARVSEPLH